MDFKVFAAEQGWTEETQVDILLQYIENQQSHEAFNDFIEEQTDLEANEEDYSLHHL